MGPILFKSNWGELLKYICENTWRNNWRHPNFWNISHGSTQNFRNNGKMKVQPTLFQIFHSKQMLNYGGFIFLLTVKFKKISRPPFESERTFRSSQNLGLSWTRNSDFQYTVYVVWVHLCLQKPCTHVHLVLTICRVNFGDAMAAIVMNWIFSRVMCTQ